VHVVGFTEVKVAEADVGVPEEQFPGNGRQIPPKVGIYVTVAVEL